MISAGVFSSIACEYALLCKPQACFFKGWATMDVGVVLVFGSNGSNKGFTVGSLGGSSFSARMFVATLFLTICISRTFFPCSEWSNSGEHEKVKGVKVFSPLKILPVASALRSRTMYSNFHFNFALVSATEMILSAPSARELREDVSCPRTIYTPFLSVNEAWRDK
jgi:hypothetical protein